MKLQRVGGIMMHNNAAHLSFPVSYLLSAAMIAVALGMVCLPACPQSRPTRNQASAAMHTTSLISEATALFQKGTRTDIQASARKYETALAHSRAVFRQVDELAALQGLAKAQAELGQRERSLATDRLAHTLARSLQDRRAEADVLADMAVSYESLARRNEENAAWEEILKIRRELGDRDGEAKALYALGDTYGELENYPQALDYAKQALAIRREMKDQSGEAEALKLLGIISYGLNERDQTYSYLNQAIVASRNAGDPYPEGVALADYATLLRNEGSSDRAEGFARQGIAACQKALTLYREKGDRPKQQKAMALIGASYVGLSEGENAIDYQQQALTLARGRGDRSAEADQLTALGNTYASMQKHVVAIEYFRQSIAVQRSISNRRGEADALELLGRSLQSESRFDDGVDNYNQALAIRHDLGDRDAEALILEDLADAMAALKQPDKQQDYLQRALTNLRATGNRITESYVLRNLGFAAYQAGEYKKAADYLEQAVTIQASAGLLPPQSIEINQIGDCYYALKDYKQAIENFERSVAIADQIHSLGEKEIALDNVGTTYVQLQDYEHAIVYYQQELTLRRQAQDRAGEAETLTSIANTQYAAKKYAESVASYKQVLAVRHELKDHKGEAEQLRNIAQVHVDAKNPEKAIEAYVAVLPIYRELKDRKSEGSVLDLIGVAYADGDQPEKAIPYYCQSLAIFHELKDRASEAILTRNIANDYLTIYEQKMATNRLQEQIEARTKALAAFEQAATINHELKDYKKEIANVSAIAEIWRKGYRWRESEAVYEHAAGIAHDSGDRSQEIDMLTLAGTDATAYDEAAGIELFNRATAVSREIHDRTREALTLSHAANTYYILGKHAESIQDYQESLAIWRNLKDTPRQREVLTELATVQSWAGKHQEALQSHQEILTLLKPGDSAELAEVLSAIGADYFALNNFDKSEDSYQQALAKYRQLNHEQDTGRGLFSLAKSQMKAGHAAAAIASADEAFSMEKAALRPLPPGTGFLDLREFDLAISTSYIRSRQALDYYSAALAYFRETKNKPREAAVLAAMAMTHRTFTEPKEAITLSTQSADLYAELGDQKNQASMCAETGAIQRENWHFDDAVKSFQQAVTIAHELGDIEAEAFLLNNVGETYQDANEPAKAVPYFEQALALRHIAPERALEAGALIVLGNAHRRLNHNEKAIELYRQAAAIQHDLKNRQGEADTLFLIGRAYWRMGKEDKISEVRQQAVAIYRELGKEKEYDGLLSTSDLLGEGRYEEFLEQMDENVAIALAQNDTTLGPTLIHSLGVGYGRLDSRDKAIQYLEMALAMNRKTHDRTAEGHDLDDLGYTYANTGDPTKALTYHAQSLAIGRETNDEALQALALDNIGAAYRRLGNFQKAVEYNEQSLVLMRKHNPELTGLNLYNLAGAYRGLKRYDDSMQCLDEALAIFRDYKNPHGIGAILTEMMFIARDADHPGIAILYGKQAVNELQTIRGRIVTLDAGTQKDFVRNFAENTYRVLADLLVDQGRLPEAQQVLGMLKEREYFDFIRRDAAADALSTRTSLTPKEIAYEQANREDSEKITALGAEFEKLRAVKSRTPEEDARFRELRDQLAQAQHSFRESLDQLRKELDGSGDAAAKSAQLADLGNSQALMSDLRELGPGTVALYTLVGTNKYRVILVTPQVQVAREYPIGGAALARKVQALRDALQNPKLDPRPAARELYNIVFAPIEKEVAGANAQTVMWSLDGVLRYVPVNALYDGHGWLLERYRNVMFTPASNARLKDPPSPEWKALALGVSRQIRNFPALPAVRDEIQGIVRDPKNGQSGVLAGDVQLDQTFTKSSMLDALQEGSHPVVHIASHFNFQPGTEVDSYLLLGDGGQFNLAELRDQSALFSGVDLLTLSACNTAMGGGGDDGGREVEGFGMLAQAQGAKAVLATLWPVADQSTGLLMREFYRLKAETPTTPKIEALRQAQLELLTGKTKASGPSTQRSLLAVEEAGDAPPFPIDPDAPFAHPYFWAPFILIGNWR
jgi:tetratricopeptide (TPR) repeat protein/CHAT domain-containing protein